MLSGDVADLIKVSFYIVEAKDQSGGLEVVAFSYVYYNQNEMTHFVVCKVLGIRGFTILQNSFILSRLFFLWLKMLSCSCLGFPFCIAFLKINLYNILKNTNTSPSLPFTHPSRFGIYTCVFPPLRHPPSPSLFPINYLVSLAFLSIPIRLFVYTNLIYKLMRQFQLENNSIG